jgi:CshA-type fibril repeat protein
VGNDSPGTITYPLDATTVLLCGATETAPACTKTTVTVAGEGTYVVKANGTVQFTPETTYSGTATPMPYSVRDSLGQVAHSTLNPVVVPPPAPITELDTGIAEQGSSVVLSPWNNDNGGVVPSGVTGTVELVPNSVRLCGSTDTAPNCTRTSLTTDDGTYTVNTTTGQVTFVHRAEFIGTVTQPVTYQIANNWTGLSGIGITTNILIPTIIPPAPPAPAPAPAPAIAIAPAEPVRLKTRRAPAVTQAAPIMPTPQLAPAPLSPRTIFKQASETIYQLQSEREHARRQYWAAQIEKSLR